MQILCPTDFSDHSRTSLEYAVNIANAVDAELHILAVFEVTKSASSLMSLEEVIRKKHEELMQELVDEFQPLMKNEKSIQTKVVKGNTVNTIQRYTKHFDIDLVIMGTQGGNSLKTILFGSTTRKLAKKSTVPILAIPVEIKHKLTSNKIIFALDSKIIDSKKIVSVPHAIAKALSLKIDILHIEPASDKVIEVLPFDPFISEYLGDSLGQVFIEKSDSINEAIKAFVAEHDYGMLLMIRREKSFLTKLLTVGNTSDELVMTEIPLMILPE